ncbi:MAG: hypothetical protein HFH68_03335 [Lachnospiraceae bacterium]|nr:hypothetical protein [Lachnospiraceae bacterium]
MEETKKLNRFYIFPVLYVLSAYMALSNIFTMQKGLLFTLMFLSPFVLGILNIVVCARCCKPQYNGIMITSAAIVKYCLVPFFVIGGFLATCTFISGFVIPVPPMFIVGPSISFMLCIAGWLVIAFGSPYTISYVVLSQRESRISKGMAVFHIILQFFFTFDVIDVICLSFMAKRNIKMTIAIIVLIAVSFIILIALVLFIILQIITG